MQEIYTDKEILTDALSAEKQQQVTIILLPMNVFMIT